MFRMINRWRLRFASVTLTLSTVNKMVFYIICLASEFGLLHNIIDEETCVDMKIFVRTCGQDAVSAR